MKLHKQYAAVLVGRKTGIYDTRQDPTEFKKQIAGFIGARYKYFDLLGTAENWLNENKDATSQNEVSTRPLDDKEALKQNIIKWKQEGKTLYFCYGFAKDNIGRGGWQVIMDNGKKIQKWHGGFKKTSSMRMEIYACLKAIFLAQKQNAIILSANKHTISVLDRGWLDKWSQNGWIKKNGKPPENADLWRQIQPHHINKNVEYVVLPDMDEILEYGDPVQAIQKSMKLKWRSVKKDLGFLSMLETKSLGRATVKMAPARAQSMERISTRAS